MAGRAFVDGKKPEDLLKTGALGDGYELTPEMRAKVEAGVTGSMYSIPKGWFKTVDIKDEHYEALLRLEAEKTLVSRRSFAWLKLVLLEGYHYSVCNYRNNTKHYITGLKSFHVELVKKRNDGRVRVKVTSENESS